MYAAVAASREQILTGDYTMLFLMLLVVVMTMVVVLVVVAM